MKKEILLLSILTGLLVLGGFFAVACGSWQIEFVHAPQILLSKMGMYTGSVNEVEAAIIWDGRLPRLIVAFMVGFSLASSGCVLQSIFKNPMASPGIIGISSGAALGAVTAIYLGFAARFLLALPVFAVVSSILTLVIVFAIATSNGHTSISTLLLAGMALNLIFGAMTSFVITLGTHDFDVGRIIVTWLMGDLNNRSWAHVYIVFPTTVMATVGTLFFVKDLNILMIDEETAANLGVNTRLSRNALLFFSSLQTGGAVAVSGVIGFVGLIAPHMVRGFIGPDNRKLIPLSGLLGAVFVIYADLFVRFVVNVDIKIGILTSLMGGPFFLFQLVKYRRQFEFFS